MAVFDTHCHLDIVASQGIPVEAGVQNAMEAGLEGLVQISTDLRSATFNSQLPQRLKHLLEARPDFQLRWTAGLHPEAADQLETLEDIFSIVRKHRDDREFLGIGETGLDYFHSTEFVEQQKQSLKRHLELAREACRQLGIEPFSTPIRGGTDGSRLTEMGVPTPNLFTGMQNIHGPLEWISVQDMARSTELCLKLAQLWCA